MSEVEVFGEPQNQVGRSVESVVAEAFVYKGELVSTANVLYFKLDENWYRAAIDAGTFHWRVQDKKPKPWEVTEEGWTYPHTDLSNEIGPGGQVLSAVKVSAEGPSVQVEFTFSGGRRLVLFNGGDFTEYHVA